MPQIRIGMSGWTFEGWRGEFYPKGVTQKKELEYASRQVNSIEINGTFYSLQKPPTFQRWHDETPNDFCFSIKAPQYITHVRRLKEVEEPVANFFASGLFCLKEKLGPILWQFPPNVTLKDDRFARFMEILPMDSKSASQIAKKHSSKMDGRSVTKAEGNYPIRHAFEFRHPSFMNPEFIELMKKHQIAVVFAHSGGISSPYMEDVTSDFIYLRMHGQDEKFKNGHTPDLLDWLAERIQIWASGNQPKDAQVVCDDLPKKCPRDVFVYFDTEAKEYAPSDALHLMKRLKVAR